MERPSGLMKTLAFEDSDGAGELDSRRHHVWGTPGQFNEIADRFQVRIEGR